MREVDYVIVHLAVDGGPVRIPDPNEWRTDHPLTARYQVTSDGSLVVEIEGVHLSFSDTIHGFRYGPSDWVAYSTGRPTRG